MVAVLLLSVHLERRTHLFPVRSRMRKADPHDRGCFSRSQAKNIPSSLKEGMGAFMLMVAFVARIHGGEPNKGSSEASVAEVTSV